MQFHEYGDNDKNTIMVVHGMICDWRKFREIFRTLEQDYHVIYPAMDGCYDGAPDFKSFSDECDEIEEYVNKNHNGKLGEFKLMYWCGSREPYARKSHEILKKHITDYEERIFEGYGHGQKMVSETEDYLDEIRKALSDQ